MKKLLAEVVLPKCEETTSRQEFQGFCSEFIAEAHRRASKAGFTGEDHSHIVNSFITRSLGVLHDIHNQDIDDKQEKLLFNGRKQVTENKRLLADAYVEHMNERASVRVSRDKNESDATSISSTNNESDISSFATAHNESDSPSYWSPNGAQSDSLIVDPERTIAFPRYVPAANTPSRPSHQRHSSSPAKKRGKLTALCLDQTNRDIMQQELDATKSKLAALEKELQATKLGGAVAEKDLLQKVASMEQRTLLSKRTCNISSQQPRRNARTPSWHKQVPKTTSRSRRTCLPRRSVSLEKQQPRFRQ
jgi:hypothetical protein